MYRRFEGAHAQHQIGQRADQRQAEIDVEHPLGDVDGARQRLAERVEPFGAKELHAAHPHLGQEHQRHDHDPEAAQPLQDAAPQQQPLGQVIQPRDHRRSGGRDTRHRFEERVDEMQIRLAQHEGQRAEQRQHHPNQRGQQKRLLNGQPLAHRILARKRHERADHASHDHAFGENRPVSAPLGDIHEKRQRHGRAHGGDHEANKISDGTHIKHDAQSWRCFATLSSTIETRVVRPQSGNRSSKTNAGISARHNPIAASSESLRLCIWATLSRRCRVSI